MNAIKKMLNSPKNSTREAKSWTQDAVEAEDGSEPAPSKTRSRGLSFGGARRRATSGDGSPSALTDEEFLMMLADGTAAEQFNMATTRCTGAKTTGYARQLMTEAAAKGHADAQYALAGMWFKGGGGPKDRNKAVVLLEQAAAQGHGDATWNLARVYELGLGVPKDIEKAEGLKQKAQAISERPSAGALTISKDE
eukprot:gb/GEZN01016381.1/.p1 GENE.gb/GEZN01016381.1/~~gb/GEZN01016381.1/.p1  ORF type:complete len:195 (+),score=42.27 gb/GEZN01016381.1/:138-722(+)